MSFTISCEISVQVFTQEERRESKSKISSLPLLLRNVYLGIFKIYKSSHNGLYQQIYNNLTQCGIFISMINSSQGTNLLRYKLCLILRSINEAYNKPSHMEIITLTCALLFTNHLAGFFFATFHCLESLLRMLRRFRN